MSQFNFEERLKNMFICKCPIYIKPTIKGYHIVIQNKEKNKEQYYKVVINFKEYINHLKNVGIKTLDAKGYFDIVIKSIQDGSYTININNDQCSLILEHKFSMFSMLDEYKLSLCDKELAETIIEDVQMIKKMTNINPESNSLSKNTIEQISNKHSNNTSNKPTISKYRKSIICPNVRRSTGFGVQF